MAKLTKDEFNRRVREAMKPPAAASGNRFAPGLQSLRQAASRRRLPAAAPVQQLPAGRG